MQVRRREVLRLGAAALALPFARPARAQPVPPLLAAIMGGSQRAADTQALLAAMREGLAAEGRTEPLNLRTELRFDATDAALAAASASELAALGPAAFLANTNIVAEEVLNRARRSAVAGATRIRSASRASRKVTRTVPVVFLPVGDPIDAGFVRSYARPGGNATGFTDFEPSHAGKWLSFLREIVPDLRRVGLMFNPDTAPRNGWFYLTAFTADALSLRIEPLAMRIRTIADIEPAIAAQAAVAGTGLIVAPDVFMMVNRSAVIDSVARHRLPAIYPYGNYTDEGGLISYSIDMVDIFRRGGAYLGRILDGESPANLPVQAPEKFQLAVNLTTARAFGLTIPPTLLATADRVIE